MITCIDVNFVLQDIVPNKRTLIFKTGFPQICFEWGNMIMIRLSCVMIMNIAILDEISIKHGNIPMVYSIHEAA